MTKSERIMFKIVKNIRRTYKNKIMALVLILLGVLSAAVDDDITVLIFMSVIGGLLFFTKKNVIY